MRDQRNSRRILSAVILLAGTAAVAAGKTIYVDANAPERYNGTSWRQAYLYLQDALLAARYGDTILVARGTYTPDMGTGRTPREREATFQLKMGVTIEGGYAGAGGPEPGIRDVELYETILSGDLLHNDKPAIGLAALTGEPSRADNSYHVVTGSGTDASTVLDGLVITGGNANRPDASFGSVGGGLFCNPGRLVLRRCTFRTNSATLYGGGMYHTMDSPRLEACVFTGNRADGRGGGLYGSQSSATLTDCNFVRNSAIDGGGIRSYDNSNPKLERCTFRGNAASGYGGGMYNTDKSSPTITDCNFIDNSAQYGGGMRNREQSSPTVERCTFRGNHASEEGGGVYNEKSNPTVRYCDFIANSAAFGAGMLNGVQSDPNIEHCEFHENTAGTSGGGMYNDAGSSPAIAGCHFIDNSSRHGAGVYNEGTSSATISRCSFRSNDASENGGGMLNTRSHVTIQRCDFSANSAKFGAGLLNTDQSDSLMEFCRFDENHADVSGGGVYNERSDPSVTDCNFIANSSVHGAGVYNDESNPRLTDCNFVSNLAQQHGGGMMNMRSRPALFLCNFKDNQADYGGAMQNEEGSDLTVNHCWFTGNQAKEDGGAMHNLQSSPEFMKCSFTENRAKYGAGMENMIGSDPNIRDDCEFVRNHAALSGGGIYNSENTPIIIDCNFIGNKAKWGGGIFNDRSWAILTDCNFIDNSATYGGGMENYDASNPNVIHCRFHGNDANDGGGAMTNDKKSCPSVTDCSFIGNTATYGGAMQSLDRSNPTIHRCTFHTNTASESGGGMHNANSAPVVNYCVFSKNKADWGGGMWNHRSSDLRNTQIVGCLFSDNWAFDAGGGLSNRESDATLVSCTFVYNGARTGGALYCSGARGVTMLHNCILWSDNATSGRECAVVDAATLSISYCNVQGGLEAAHTTASFALSWGAGNIEDDPNLTPNGHLTAGSPCIDRGDHTALPNGNENDIDDEPRVVGARIDIGCDEFIDSDGDGLPDAWEQMYFDDAGAAVAQDDPDGDGLTNLDEYVLYSSSPRAAPYYVAAGPASASPSDGTREHPFGTIREGLEAARDGDTVLVAPGTYAGSGNTNLDFAGKAVILCAPGGPSSTVITGSGARGLFTFVSHETPASALVGFTIRGGWAECGGAILCRQSYPQIRDCILDSNRAAFRGGAIYCDVSMPRVADCVIRGSENEGIYISFGGARLEGRVRLISDKLETHGAFLWGVGQLEIDSDSEFCVYGDLRLRCHLRGSGKFQIETNAECTIEGTAIVDLGDGGQGKRGEIECHGLLRMKDRTELRNARLRVTRAQFEDHVVVSNSVITAEAGAPFGQFFVQDTVRIRGNEIHADGDRYMDLDPAAFRGIIENNRIYVTITEGQNNTLGGLLELRGKDQERYHKDCPADTYLCRLAEIPEFNTETWTIEQLELKPGAKVNLTNRFDFGNRNGNLAEVMYVKKLVLGKDAVLNTAFQRLYYGQLEPEAAERGTVVDVPILGFSLNNIAFDNADDFASRVVSNNFKHTNSDYDRLHVTLVPGQEPDPKGMMKMCTKEDAEPNTPTTGQIIPARAKGLFARSSEKEILVRLEYLFCSTQGELVIYLSDVPELLSHDDPARAVHYVEVGRVTPPPPGWPGAAGSGRFGAFEKIVSVQDLNFLGGTRIELEFVSDVETCIWINNWDPDGLCADSMTCGNVAGSHGTVNALDFLAVLTACGRRLATQPDETTGTKFSCMDCWFSQDGVITLEDALAVEWLTLGDVDFPCRTVPSFSSSGTAAPEPTKGLSASGMSQSSAPGAALSFVAKGHGLPGAPCLEDYLYEFTAAGAPVDKPAPVPGGKVITRIIRNPCDPPGTICYLDMQEGLLRDGRPIIPPGEYPYASAKSRIVYVGRSPDLNPRWRVPLQDVAFDKDGYAYVVPVIVNRDGGTDPSTYYRAAARLRLEPGEDPPYRVVQLYDTSKQHGYGLHEIEVDDDGWVYVLKLCPNQRKDSLYVFNGATGEERPGTPCVPLDGKANGPTCLHVSKGTGKPLYLASALNAPDANETSLHVLNKETLAFVGPAIKIPGMGHITGITEDPAGTLWAAGFTLTRLPLDLEMQDDDSSLLFQATSFYRPCLARIEPNGPQPKVGVVDLGQEWVLPISVVWTGSAGQ